MHLELKVNNVLHSMSTKVMTIHAETLSLINLASEVLASGPEASSPDGLALEGIDDDVPDLFRCLKFSQSKHHFPLNKRGD